MQTQKARPWRKCERDVFFSEIDTDKMSTNLWTTLIKDIGSKKKKEEKEDEKELFEKRRIGGGKGYKRQEWGDYDQNALYTVQNFKMKPMVLYTQYMLIEP